MAGSYDDFITEDEGESLADIYHQSGNVRDDQTPKAGHNEGMTEDEAFADMELDDIFKEARRTLLVKLVTAVREGYATPADMNTLRQLLKDNGYVMGDILNEPTGGESDSKKEKAPLPSFTKPDWA